MSKGGAQTTSRNRFKSYPDYKDSGVEWLGQIPAQWEVLALKRRAKRIQTGTTPPTAEKKYYEDGIIAWYGPGSFADDLPLQAPIKLISESAVRDGVARVFASGSAVIVTIGATIGKVAYMEQAGSCNQQITGITFDPRHLHAKYGAYQLKRLEPVLRGIAPNTTLPILDQEKVGYLPFVVPPQSQQCAIAVFLDRETTKIDALLAKKERLIELLQEKRTALITQAVTKGLNPAVHMKDSGVEWLGEIPAAWGLKRLKRVVSFQGGGTPAKDNVEYWQGDIPWVSPKDMKVSVVVDTEDKITPQAIRESATNLVPAGAVLIVVRSGILAHTIPVALAGCEVTLNQDLKAMIPRSELLPQYLVYLLSGKQRELLFEWKKEGATVESLELDLVVRTPIPVPDLDEQHAIVIFLDREIEKIDALVARISAGIDKVKEYRTALISAAVTGKVDVRGGAA